MCVNLRVSVAQTARRCRLWARSPAQQQHPPPRTHGKRGPTHTIAPTTEQNRDQTHLGTRGRRARAARSAGVVVYVDAPSWRVRLGCSAGPACLGGARVCVLVRGPSTRRSYYRPSAVVVAAAAAAPVVTTWRQSPLPLPPAWRPMVRFGCDLYAGRVGMSVRGVSNAYSVQASCRSGNLWSGPSATATQGSEEERWATSRSPKCCTGADRRRGKTQTEGRSTPLFD